MTITRFGRQAKAALAKLGRQAKRPHGLCAKLTTVVVLGLCFIFIWFFFSSTPNSVTEQRESFGDISEPASENSYSKINNRSRSRNSSDSSDTKSIKHQQPARQWHHHSINSSSWNRNVNDSNLRKPAHEKGNWTVTSAKGEHNFGENGKERDGAQSDMEKEEDGSERSENEALDEDKAEDGNEGEEALSDGKENGFNNEGARNGNNEGDGEALMNGRSVDFSDDATGSKGRGHKNGGPVFDPNASYTWKLCRTRSKHNYIPCLDTQTASGTIHSYRHHERSCPWVPPMCLVPLPHSGYATPVHWPESKSKILYKNIAHPKLASYIKAQSWIVESGEYLRFPRNESAIKGGIAHYLDSLEEMIPDIEWGKNVRVVLDIGCTDSSFGAFLLEKGVLPLSIGLNNDLVGLAQIALERGFPTVVSPFAHRRLPFPGNIFDAIHCGGCNIRWSANGGKLLLEMNRILRPGGYFILSVQHNSIEREEAMTSLTASICWNVLTDRSDEVSEVAVKIYQKPDSNSIYELRRKKNPPLCNENENPDAVWHVPITNCLYAVPAAIEQHGSEWPAEWPNRLETYPDWLSNKDKVKADTGHWKSIVEKSYLTGMGIDWGKIRNVMDMKAIYGGFAAALSEQKVWVMNVVPIQALDTLPYVYERGLFGIYHDWCEPFGTYPRSYDLLHADHLFSRLKYRCKHPVAIVIEMDRILRPGGWVIVRDKVQILEPLEGILRSLKWEIRMTFAQEKEGILCAQKTTWRP